MNNPWTLSATSAAIAFATAVASPAFAQEGAPDISPERLDIIRLCEERIRTFIDDHDTRADGTSMQQYYFYNEDNAEAVRTAVKTGEYEAELDALNAWARLQSMAAYSLVMNSGFHCAILADENGHMDTTHDGRAQLEMYAEWTDVLVDSSNRMYEIVSMLKEEGDKLIAEGATPVGPREPVFLFR